MRSRSESTATKTKAAPSATVTVAVMSVPHITSGASVVMVQSCAFGPCAWPARGGAWRSCSRNQVSKKTLGRRTSGIRHDRADVASVGHIYLTRPA